MSIHHRERHRNADALSIGRSDFVGHRRRFGYHEAHSELDEKVGVMNAKREILDTPHRRS